MKSTFLDLVTSRFSARGYLPDPVQSEKLELIMEAVRLSPSACNKQPWRFTLVTDPEIRNVLCEKGMGGAVPNKWAVTAPLIAVLSVTTSPVVHTAGKVLKGVDFRLVDAGIAGEHFCLAAAEQGLQTCWIGWFNPGKVRKIISLPISQKIVSLITLGYPREEQGPGKKRKPMEEICFAQKFGTDCSALFSPGDGAV